jgi:hypothetical protein
MTPYTCGIWKYCRVWSYAAFNEGCVFGYNEIDHIFYCRNRKCPFPVEMVMANLKEAVP